VSEVGLLPALGGGIGDLEATGQASRLIDGYLRPYARAFDRVWYFSYLPEALGAPGGDGPGWPGRSRCRSSTAASSGAAACTACSR
jgi:hypothetical protein